MTAEDWGVNTSFVGPGALPGVGSLQSSSGEVPGQSTSAEEAEDSPSCSERRRPPLPLPQRREGVQARNDPELAALRQELGDMQEVVSTAVRQLRLQWEDADPSGLGELIKQQLGVRRQLDVHVSQHHADVSALQAQLEQSRVHVSAAEDTIANLRTDLAALRQRQEMQAATMLEEHLSQQDTIQLLLRQQSRGNQQAGELYERLDQLEQRLFATKGGASVTLSLSSSKAGDAAGAVAADGSDGSTCTTLPESCRAAQEAGHVCGSEGPTGSAASASVHPDARDAHIGKDDNTRFARLVGHMDAEIRVDVATRVQKLTAELQNEMMSKMSTQANTAEAHMESIAVSLKSEIVRLIREFRMHIQADVQSIAADLRTRVEALEGMERIRTPRTWAIKRSDEEVVPCQPTHKVLRNSRSLSPARSASPSRMASPSRQTSRDRKTSLGRPASPLQTLRTGLAGVVVLPPKPQGTAPVATRAGLAQPSQGSPKMSTSRTLSPVLQTRSMNVTKTLQVVHSETLCMATVREPGVLPADQSNKETAPSPAAPIRRFGSCTPLRAGTPGVPCGGSASPPLRVWNGEVVALPVAVPQPQLPQAQPQPLPQQAQSLQQAPPQPQQTPQQPQPPQSLQQPPATQVQQHVAALGTSVPSLWDVPPLEQLTVRAQAAPPLRSPRSPHLPLPPHAASSPTRSIQARQEPRGPASPLLCSAARQPHPQAQPRARPAA